MKKNFLLAVALAASFGAAQASTGAAEAAKPSGAPASVSVSGATSVKAESPLVLTVDGKVMIDPDFEAVYKAASENPNWLVLNIKPSKSFSTVTLVVPGGKTKLTFDVADAMMKHTKLAISSNVSMEVQRMGGRGLVKIVAGAVPIGYLTND